MIILIMRFHLTFENYKYKQMKKAAVKTFFIFIVFVSLNTTTKSQNIQEANSFSIDKNELTAINITPDNSMVICGFKDGDIIAYETLSGKKVFEVKRHDNDIHSINFNKKGKYFASAGQDKATVVWSVATGKQLKTYNSGDAVWTTEFTPDGKYIATAGTDQLITVWELVSGKRYRSLWGHSNRVYELKITSDGKYIISVSGDYTMKKWDISKQLKLKSVKAHDNDVTSVDISKDNKIIVTASKDMTVRLWDFDTFDNIAVMRGHQWWINKVRFSPDTKYIASASVDQSVILWDTETHDIVKKLQFDGPVKDVEFSRDGTYLVACDDHKVRIFTTGFTAASN